MPTVLPQLDASYISDCNNIADAKAYIMENLPVSYSISCDETSAILQ